MKKFKFKYSPIVWLLLVVVFLFSLAGLIYNIFNLTQYLWADAFKLVSLSLIILINAFLLIFVLSVLVYGNYVIKNQSLFIYFGFIYSKINIMDIVEISHFKKSDKLVVYLKDQKYSVIVISKDKYEDFILSIREVNRAIYYDIKIEGEDLPE